MTTETTPCIAIRFAVEDENTGATAMYHVIEYVSIDYRFQTATATLNGYVSKKMKEAGKQPLCSHSLTVNGFPEEGEITRAWLYAKAVEEGNESSIFTGGELVTE